MFALCISIYSIARYFMYGARERELRERECNVMCIACCECWCNFGKSRIHQICSGVVQKLSFSKWKHWKILRKLSRKNRHKLKVVEFRMKYADEACRLSAAAGKKCLALEGKNFSVAWARVSGILFRYKHTHEHSHARECWAESERTSERKESQFATEGLVWRTEKKLSEAKKLIFEWKLP
jgi:hypothetical protein